MNELVCVRRERLIGLLQPFIDYGHNFDTEDWVELKRLYDEVKSGKYEPLCG